MKLRLPLNRCIGVGLVTLGAGLAREAAEQLGGGDKVSVESVHRARVALKRVRSVLRLLEKAGAAWAITPRYRLAQLAGTLAPARDSAVVRDLAQNLARRLSRQERAVALLLAAKKSRLPRRDEAQIRQALLQEARELAAAPAPVISPAQMRELLRGSLQRSGRRFSAAFANPTAESVHEWRKTVIVLRDQTALAARHWERGAGVANPWLVRFARRLGCRGDVALLECRLQSLRVAPAHRLARRRLLARLEEQREEATWMALLSWPKLERRLTRLLSEPHSAG
jgi:hypothetical protein